MNLLKMDAIDELLANAKKPKKKIQPLPIPKEILITTKAREKARRLGPEVARIGEGAFEWYGFVLGSESDPQKVVREVILAQDQDVSGGMVEVEGEKVAQVGKEVEIMNKERGTDYVVVGWIHNHADFGVHHSEMDKRNFLQVLNSASLNTEKSVQMSFPLIEGEVTRQRLEDRLEVRGSKITDGSLVYTFPEEGTAREFLKKHGIDPKEEDPRKVAAVLLDDLLGAAELESRQSRIVGFCYSIVVNNKGDDPHSEIAVVEEQVVRKEKKIYTREIPLKVVDVPDDITFTDAELETDIRKRIRFPVKTFKSYPGGSLMRKLSRFIKGGEDDDDDSPVRSYTTGTNRSGDSSKNYSNSWQSSKITLEESETSNAAVKTVSLEELAGLFAKKVVSYVDFNYGYTQFMANVLSSLLTKQAGVAQAFCEVASALLCKEKAGGSASVARGIKNNSESILGKAIYDSIALGTAQDWIGENKNELAIKFMVDFVNSGLFSDCSGVIESYVPHFLKVDPLVQEFSREAVAYAASYGHNGKYSLWWSHVLSSFESEEKNNLENSILSLGTLVQKNQEISGMYKLTLSEDRSRARIKLLLGEYTPEEKEFMAKFNVKDTRDEAIKEYSERIYAKHAQKDAEGIDALLQKSKLTAIKADSGESNPADGGKSKPKRGIKRKKADSAAAPISTLLASEPVLGDGELAAPPVVESMVSLEEKVAEATVGVSSSAGTSAPLTEGYLDAQAIKAKFVETFGNYLTAPPRSGEYLYIQYLGRRLCYLSSRPKSLYEPGKDYLEHEIADTSRTYHPPRSSTPGELQTLGKEWPWICKHLIATEFSSRTLAFMKDFCDPEKREAAVESYINAVEKNQPYYCVHPMMEEKQLDSLLKDSSSRKGGGKKDKPANGESATGTAAIEDATSANPAPPVLEDKVAGAAENSAELSQDSGYQLKIRFATQFEEYLRTPSNRPEATHRYWLSGMIYRFGDKRINNPSEKTEKDGLVEAVQWAIEEYSVGRYCPADSAVLFPDENISRFLKEKWPRIKGIVVGERYSPRTLAFMKDFCDPEKREAAIYGYAKAIQEDKPYYCIPAKIEAVQQEGDQLDRILGKYSAKTSGTPVLQTSAPEPVAPETSSSGTPYSETPLINPADLVDLSKKNPNDKEGGNGTK